MFFANDHEGKRVHIRSADPSKVYTCPLCKEELTQRHGTTNEHCFAHKKGSDCDQWGCMSMWHNEWQKQFPEESQEVVLRGDNEIHRADISINNMVIEFQSSPISAEELQKRICFYTKFGLLVFVFDVQDKSINVNENMAFWSSPSRSILPPDNALYFLFLQISKDQLLLVDRQIDGWSKFRITRTYSKDEFIDAINTNRLILTLYSSMYTSFRSQLHMKDSVISSLHNTISSLKKEKLTDIQVQRDIKAEAQRQINELEKRIDELNYKLDELTKLKSIEVEKIVEKEIPVPKIIEKEKPVYLEKAYTLAKKALREEILTEVGRYISVAATNNEREKHYSRTLLDRNLTKVIDKLCITKNIEEKPEK